MSRVLVDGAAGFLGRHVLGELLERGHAVRGTDLADAPPFEHERLEWRRRDLCAEPIADLFDDVDRVVHVAGLFDLGAPADRLMRVNRQLARQMAEAAVDRGVRRFVHVSSVTVYGRPRRVPATETAPFRPGNPYERSKAAGEREVWRLVDDRSLPAVVLRPSGIYGPFGRYGLAVLASALVLAKETGRTGGLRAYRGGPAMNHVHVQDVARAVAHVLETDAPVAGRAFNVADDTPMPWGDLVQELADRVDVDLGRPRALSHRRARFLARSWRWMPASRRDRINRSFERRWKDLCTSLDLEPALTPRFDRYAYDYWLSDHVYDNAALARTGFALRHSDCRSGLADTLSWYARNRWLPAISGGGVARGSEEER